MSGYDNYSEIFDGDGHEEQSGGGLRKQLEEALSVNRKLTERLDRLEQKAPMEALFKEKGIDPAAVALVPAGAKPEEWLEQNARFLKGFEAPGTDQQQQAAPEVQQHQEDPDLEAERRQIEDLEEAGETGIPSTATADQLQKLQSFDTEEELLAYIRSGGNV